MMLARVQHRVFGITHAIFFAMVLLVLSGCHTTRPIRSETPIIDTATLSPVAREIQRRGYRALTSELQPPTPWEVTTFRMKGKRRISFRAEQPLPNERETYYCRFWLWEETYDSDDDARQRLVGLHRVAPDATVEEEFISPLRDGLRVGPVAYIFSTDATIFMAEIRKLTTTLAASIDGAEPARSFIQAPPNNERLQLTGVSVTFIR